MVAIITKDDILRQRAITSSSSLMIMQDVLRVTDVPARDNFIGLCDQKLVSGYEVMTT